MEKINKWKKISVLHSHSVFRYIQSSWSKPSDVTPKITQDLCFDPLICANNKISVAFSLPRCLAGLSPVGSIVLRSKVKEQKLDLDFIIVASAVKQLNYGLVILIGLRFVSVSDSTQDRWGDHGLWSENEEKMLSNNIYEHNLYC